MKHLTVKIEKRFKKQLSKRFNPRNSRVSKHGVYGREINVGCCLCGEYYNTYNTNGCSKCPFREFEDKTANGCIIWLNRILGREWEKIISPTIGKISWCPNNNKEVIKLLKKLRERAKEYIIWTENKNE